MSVPSSCVKCGGVMQEGFIIDNDRYPRASEWAMGMPVWKIFGTVKADKQDRFRVRTFACLDCGYLESYLSPEE